MINGCLNTGLIKQQAPASLFIV